jgi:hypothetical protein
MALRHLVPHSAYQAMRIGPSMDIHPRIRRWLTGPRSDPSVRVRYWTEVERRPSSDPVVRRAAASVGQLGWASSLLDFQLSGGQWATPGASPLEVVRPRFSSTHWVATVLADLGMTRSDPRIQRTARIILRWREAELADSDAELCFVGNATRTLVRFGYLDHPVVHQLIDWLVRAQKSDGGWHCFPVRTGTLDSWEGLAALAEIPEASRDPPIQNAIERGAQFYLMRRLMKEGPTRYDPWFRIHFPNHYFYDVLVGLRILTRLGYGGDRRLDPAVRWLKERRRRDGTWALDAVHPAPDEFDMSFLRQRALFPLMFEPLNLPSRWATVEALSVLTAIERARSPARSSRRGAGA